MRIVMVDWARSGVDRLAVRASVPADAVARKLRREIDFTVSLLGASAPPIFDSDAALSHNRTTRRKAGHYTVAFDRAWKCSSPTRRTDIWRRRPRKSPGVSGA